MNWYAIDPRQVKKDYPHVFGNGLTEKVYYGGVCIRRYTLCVWEAEKTNGRGDIRD